MRVGRLQGYIQFSPHETTAIKKSITREKHFYPQQKVAQHELQ